MRAWKHYYSHPSQQDIVSKYAFPSFVGKELRTFSYIDKKIYGAKLSYTVTKKEFLAVIYAINKLRHY